MNKENQEEKLVETIKLDISSLLFPKDHIDVSPSENSLTAWMLIVNMEIWQAKDLGNSALRNKDKVRITNVEWVLS